MPDILNNIQTVVLPSPKMGWWNRKKTEHFKAYSAIVQDFAKEFNLDPWLFDGYFEEVSDINFKEGKNYEDLKDKISILYNKIQAKYREYGISKNPSIFIKSNRGTYGMGVHVIQSPEEVLEFNKNIRKKMSTTKDGIENTSVIIQEGVETIFKTDDGKAVEPVVYSAISKPIGMFFRINDGFLSNLNSKGMELTNEFPLTKPQTILINLIGGLTNLAITREMEEKLSK
jgi:glutamate--cysteine ligase